MALPAPQVRLGTLAGESIAAGIYALVVHGVRRRPGLAHGIDGELVLRFDEGYAPVTIRFADGDVLVEDQVRTRSGLAEAGAPDCEICAPLPDLIALAVAPTVAGLPSPLAPRGRAALGSLASGRVQVIGSRALARKLLALLRID